MLIITAKREDTLLPLSRTVIAFVHYVSSLAVQNYKKNAVLQASDGIFLNFLLEYELSFRLFRLFIGYIAHTTETDLRTREALLNIVKGSVHHSFGEGFGLANVDHHADAVNAAAKLVLVLIQGATEVHLLRVVVAVVVLVVVELDGLSAYAAAVLGRSAVNESHVVGSFVASRHVESHVVIAVSAPGGEHLNGVVHHFTLHLAGEGAEHEGSADQGNTFITKVLHNGRYAVNTIGRQLGWRIDDVALLATVETHRYATAVTVGDEFAEYLGIGGHGFHIVVTAYDNDAAEEDKQGGEDGHKGPAELTAENRFH